METTMTNNRVTIEGRAVSEFTYSHEAHGEKFYRVELAVERLSGVQDIIPVIVSERLTDVSKEITGKSVSVVGQFRSYNQFLENRKNKLILTVFATEFDYKEDCTDVNTITMTGFICKKPAYRETPLGREIADMIIAINRNYGKSDYIPCICWGRNARFASGLEVGTNIEIEGRIQSREYQKKISETEVESRVAYEVSVSGISVITKED